MYRENTQRKKQSVKLSQMMAILKILLFQGGKFFRLTVFIPMIGHLLTAFQKRLEAYDPVSGKFGFLSKMPSVNCDQLRDAAERLLKTNPKDLNTSLPEYMTKPDVWPSEKVKIRRDFIALRMLQTIVNNDMQDTIPNMYICLCIYSSLLIINCSGERSFSALKRIKNYL